MPYYDEWYLNGATVSSLERRYTGLVNSDTGFVNLDVTHLKTFRTRPSRSPFLYSFSEVLPEKADPYANLVESRGGIKRNAALARGFDASLFQTDRGHPFELVRYKSNGSLWSGSFYTTANYLDQYRGANLGLVNASGTITIPLGFAPVGWSDLDAYGASTYAKAAPTKEVFNLAVFLGELREGLPRLGLELLTKSQKFKSLGSDYLSVEFGWKPFISDLQAAASALMGATTALLGPIGPVHRLRREDAVSSMSSSKSQSGAPLYGLGQEAGPPDLTAFLRGMHPAKWDGDFTLGTAHLRLGGDITVSERIESERWFEGSFAYIPKIGFDATSYWDRLGALVATDITPSVLWELAPWSWLTDYFLKIGNAIAALETASDNRIVSNYAYAMEKRTTTRGAFFTNLSSLNYVGPSTITRTWVTTGKRRIRANPYGFKPMTNTALNPGQWAILAALGLTKAGR